MSSRQKDFTIDVKLSAKSTQTLVNDIVGQTTNKTALRYMAVDVLSKYFELGGSVKSLNKLIQEYDEDFKVVQEEHAPMAKKHCRAVPSAGREVSNY